VKRALCLLGGLVSGLEQSIKVCVQSGSERAPLPVLVDLDYPRCQVGRTQHSVPVDIRKRVRAALGQR
jgi:hypothetical protein